MRLRTFLKPLSFLPAIFMMYVIFQFSAQEADLSSSLSSRASYAIVKAADYILDTNMEEWQIRSYAEKIHGVTRKLAHMTEYFLLAIAVSFPLYVYGLHGILLVLVAGIICVGYACTDEYHQSFVAGRAASMKDVGIDGVGVLLGTLLVRIIGWTGRHTIFRSRDDGYQRMTRREIKNLKKQQRRMEQELKERQTYGSYSPGPHDSAPYDNSPYRRGSYDHYGSRSYPRGSYDDDGYNEDPYYNRRNTSASPYGGSEDPYGHAPNPYANPYANPYDSRGSRRDDAYYDEDYEEEPSSDELSEDMPFSKLFRK